MYAHVLSGGLGGLPPLVYATAHEAFKMTRKSSTLGWLCLT